MTAEPFDVTARKVHQWTMVALVLIGFVLGGLLTDMISAILLFVAGLIMLVGRFWWPADVVRQITWRVLEPRGIVHRVDREEDHQTRRIARVIGGAVWLVSGVLLLAGVTVVGWVLALLIAAMVVLDAALDFCVLCFAFLHLERRGLLPGALRHS
jgi:hypothetical protein